MTDVTQILNAIQQGDLRASEELLPLVYDELRVLARQRLGHEKPGQTLQATALVHEAYLRLVGNGNDPNWDNRGHFFAAAAEAMRRILVDNARRKLTAKRGGNENHQSIESLDIPLVVQPAEVIAVNEGLDALAIEDKQAAEIVKLHYFAGFSIEEAAEAIGISRATAYRLWTFARAWLKSNL
jgi:RNA polymerase sigma factor (TIGR02999 family)